MRMSLFTNVGTSEKRSQSAAATASLHREPVPGQYRIDVEKPGFKHFARTGSRSKSNKAHTSMPPSKSARSARLLK